MPWKQERHYGPTCFADAIGGRTRSWTNIVYVPVGQDDLARRAEEISELLSHGAVLDADRRIDNLSDHVKEEKILVSSLEKARQELAPARQLAQSLESIAGTGADVSELADPVRLKIIDSSIPAGNRLSCLAEIYFDGIRSTNEFLAAVYMRKDSPEVDAALDRIPESIRTRIRKSYDIFYDRQTGCSIKDKLFYFRELQRGCAQYIAEALGCDAELVEIKIDIGDRD